MRNELVKKTEPGDRFEKTVIVFDLLDHLDHEHDIERIEIQSFLPGNGWMRFSEVSIDGDTPVWGGKKGNCYPVFKVVLSGHKVQSTLVSEPPVE